MGHDLAFRTALRRAGLVGRRRDLVGLVFCRFAGLAEKIPGIFPVRWARGYMLAVVVHRHYSGKKKIGCVLGEKARCFTC